MTIQLVPSSGDSTYDSSKYTATVNATTAQVYGFARTAEFDCTVWDEGDSIEAHWLKFGSNETTTTVNIVRTAGAITEAIVYPKDKGITQTIETDGSLTLVFPDVSVTPIYLRVELNGDRKEPINVFACRIWSTAPVSDAFRTDFTDLGVSVSSVDTGTDTWTTAAAHGYSGGEFVHLRYATTQPTVADTEPLYWWHEYEIDVVSTTEFRLINAETAAVFNVTADGTGAATLTPSFYTDTSKPLYFPLGVHYMGRMMAMADDTEAFIEAGAVVLGGFDLRGVDGVDIHGPGVMRGVTDRVELLADPSRTGDFEWLTSCGFFYGQDGVNFSWDNKAYETTFVGSPYYFMRLGLWSLTDAQIIQPWEHTTDGPKMARRTVVSGNDQGLLERVFSWVADDNCYLRATAVGVNVADCFLLNNNGCSLHGGFFEKRTATQLDDNPCTITRVDVMNFGVTDTHDLGNNAHSTKGNTSVFRCWVDNDAIDADKGNGNYTFTNIKVWGLVAGRAFSYGNRVYPFVFGSGGDRYGICRDHSFDEIWFEETPMQLSFFAERDASNKPTGFSFADVEIGGIKMHQGNYQLFWEEWTLAEATFLADPDPDIRPVPGNDDDKSSIYTVTVDGTAHHCYAHTETAEYKTTIWENQESVTRHWLKYGANKATTITVTKMTDDITHAEIYPKNIGVTHSVTAGVLTINVPTPTNPIYLWVEVNDERNEALSVFAMPHWSAPVSTWGSFTNWSGLVRRVESVLTTDEGFRVYNHGYSTNDWVTVYVPDGFEGTMPVANGATIYEYEPYQINKLGDHHFQLIDPDTASAFDITSDAVGTIMCAPAVMTAAQSPLYFPHRQWSLGAKFDVPSDAELYFEAGAVVKATFQFYQEYGITWRGPGAIKRPVTRRSLIDDRGFTDAADRKPFRVFQSDDATRYDGTSEVKELTVFGQISHHLADNSGVSTFENMQCIAPWDFNADGPKTAYRDSFITHCYTFMGDDNIQAVPRGGHLQVTGGFYMSAGLATIFGNYRPPSQDESSSSCTIDGIHIMHVGIDDLGTGFPDDGVNAIFRSTTDGTIAQQGFGFYNLTCQNINVWGPFASRAFVYGNKLYPFPEGPFQAQIGILQNFLFSNITFEEEPGQKSQLVGLDLDNTPSNFTFTGITFGETTLYEENKLDWFQPWTIPFDIFFDAQTVPVSETDLVAEDGTGKADANSYATVAQADTYHNKTGAPAAWTAATDAAKSDALRFATRALDLWYGMRWSGRRYTSTQALDWPRIRAADVRGVEILHTEMPQALIDATAELALQHINGKTLFPATRTAPDIGSESRSIGGLSHSSTYRGSRNPEDTFPTMHRMLRVANLLTSPGVGWGVAGL